MATQLDVPLASAALNERERRVLGRLVEALRAHLGPDLLALWLYGSRARGEADPTETDPDLRSDVDLLAIVVPERDAVEVSWEVMPLVEAAADAEGDSPVYFSLRVFDADYLRERREIRSFFIQEVDRDKLVLHGSRLEEPGSIRWRRSSRLAPWSGRGAIPAAGDGQRRIAPRKRTPTL